jgi:hypothetical protein
MGAQKRENPVISDWVRVSGGSTEGSLGEWLAQRQAALREVMAAGHFQPLRWVFGACRFSLEQIACHKKVFLESARDSIWVEFGKNLDDVNI